MAFIDKAKIYIKSGNGGHGALSFRREKFVEYGGPNGGNGGKGGDVIFRGNKGINTLQRYRFNQHHNAQNGICLLYTSPSPRDPNRSRMPSSA